MRNQNHILTPSEWSHSGESAAATAQTITHTPQAYASSYVAGIFVQTSDSSRVTWTLESPDGNILLRGWSSNDAIITLRPALEAPRGSAVLLKVAAGNAGVTTRANIWGYDLADPRP